MEKRLIAVLFCIVLMFSSVSAFAVGQQESELEYALSQASSLLTKNEYDIQNHAYLSEPIPKYTLDPIVQTANIYLIFDGQSQIGIVSVHTQNGQRYSTASLQSFEQLEEFFLNETEIAFFQGENSLLVHGGEQWAILKNPSDADFDIINIAIDGVQHSDITLSEEVSLSNGRSIYYRLNGVPFAYNDTSPEGLPLCWAASMAMKISHQGDLRTPLTAMDVYYACKTANPSGIPMGTDEWFEVAAEEYDIPLTIVNGHISKTTISRCFNQDKPIILGMQGEYPSSPKHTVVLCGIDEYSSYYELAILDPDLDDDFAFTTIPLSCLNYGDDFYYDNGITIFTNWIASRY